MISISNLHSRGQQILNWAVTLGSVLVCGLLLLIRLPGMELLGFGPNWLLIWVVAWSVKRTVIEGAIAGFALGLIQDGLTFPQPSHVVSLACVGILTALLKKQRYIQEDFISVALIVFGMVLVAEMVEALQFSLIGSRNPAEIWTDYQRIALSSAIISSLWAPVAYYPLNRWWKQMNLLEKS